MKKEKKYLLYGIGLVLLTLIGVTFAYFSTQIVGNRKNVTINTADLRIIFTNGDSITGNNIGPGWSITKTFSVENKTKSDYKYNIVIKDLLNNFVTEGYLQYKITSSNGFNMSDFEDVPKRSSANDTTLAYNINISSRSLQEYTIVVQYKNDEAKDQSVDMAKTLSGKLFIAEGTEEPTLKEAMLRDNPTISERTDFSVTNTANTTGTIYKTNKTEDGSDVYYYSGNTTNNWVKFGKEATGCTYNGSQVLVASTIDMAEEDGTSSVIIDSVKKVNSSEECTSTNICVDKTYGPVVGLTEEECKSLPNGEGTWTTDKATYDVTLSKDIYWRIIRTNEDRSVRLLYSGNSHDTTMGYIGMSAFNESNNDPMYVGYKYGKSGSLANNRTNKLSSTIKTYIDNWYQSNLLNNYDKYISQTAIYCSDRSTQNNSYSTSSAFNYGTYTRLADNKVPTYKCGGDGNGGLFESTQASTDKLSGSLLVGYGQLKYPIALMTADEVAFAGGKNTTKLSSPYTWYYTNSQGESITGTKDWWTLSPQGWNGLDADVWYVFGSSNKFRFGSLDAYSVQASIAVRPSISLYDCAKIKSGNGTPESPYEVNYTDSCASQM